MASEQLTFQLALLFFKDEKNRVALAYNTNVRLFALWKQVSRGKLDESKENPVGFFDFIGRDRRRAWRALDAMPQLEAMTTFSELLLTEHPVYPTWLEQRIKEKEEKDRRDREQQERERQVREQFERDRQERIRRQEEERARKERDRLDREHEEERQRALATRAATRPAPPVPSLPKESPAVPQTTASESAKPEIVSLAPALTPDVLKANAIKNGSILEITRGEVVRVKVPNPGGELRRVFWQFMTEARDIGFGIDYETPKSAAKSSTDSSEPSSPTSDDVELQSIKPITRCGYNQEIISGSHTMQTAGSWLLLFDNSFSYLRSKKVYYHVEYQPI